MIDLAQFHEMFFDESEELLDRADVLLPECVQVASPEALAELRRCAHSIKGGCATFGFTLMAECAAALERVLGLALKSGEQLEPGVLEACGEAFAVLRELGLCQRRGTDPDANRVAKVVSRLAAGSVPSSIDAEERLQGPCYDFSFAMSRTLVGGDLLIEDMLERLACVGRVMSTRGPAPEDQEGRWHLRVEAAPGATQAGLREIVERLADPDSLQVRVIETKAADASSAPAKGANQSSDDAGVDAQEPDPTAQAGSGDPVTSRAPAAENSDRCPPRPVNYLVFGVGGQRYATRADEVVEVRPCSNLQPLPGAPKAVLGVVDVRDEFVPVIDSRNCLGVTAASPTPLTPVMMLHVESGLVGVLVDELGDIVALESSAIQAPHRLFANRGFVQIVGLSRHQGQLLTVIDLTSLIRSVGLARSGVFAVA